MMHWFLTAFVVVLSAELAGDKLVYTTAVLTRRYRVLPLAAGLIAGFITKMGVAVALGRVVLSLPRSILIASTTITCAAMVVRLCLPEERRLPGRSGGGASEASVIGFASVVFGEWADPGQLAAAALVMESRAPFVIWVAAVMAMATKAVFALTIGGRALDGLSRLLPDNMVRAASIAIVVCAGLIALAEVIAM
jgi:putative Ca2+/H+ antiporter (TMEM165/GDT1 family)